MLGHTLIYLINAQDGINEATLKKKFPPCSFSSFTKKMGFVGVKFINYAIYLTVIAHFFQSAFPAFLNIIIIFTQYFTIFSSLLFRGYLI